jgi:hypothetical protein
MFTKIALSRLALVLKGKLAAAALGALVVTGGGAAVTVAATTGHLPAIARVSGASAASRTSTGRRLDKPSTPSETTPSPGDTPSARHASRATPTPSAADDTAHTDSLEGMLLAYDAAADTFLLARSDGTQVTVSLSAQTKLDGGLAGLGDVPVGASVEVNGEFLADGTFAATSIEVPSRDGQSSNGNDGSGGDGHSTGGSGHTGDSGSGGTSTSGADGDTGGSAGGDSHGASSGSSDGSSAGGDGGSTSAGTSDDGR